MVGRMSLPFLNLVRFAKRVLGDFFFRNNGLLLTSAVAYNALLSLIPLSAVLMVGLSHFVDESLVLESVTTEVSLIVPGATPMLTEVLETFMKSRELAGWIGVAILLFFSSVAFRVLENAMAIIFHQPVLPVKRRFWVSALLPYLFILLVAAGLIVVTALNAVIDTIQAQAVVRGTETILQRLIGVSLYVVGVLGLVLLFTTLYKVMPTTKISFKLALSGGITAAMLWEILRHLLVSYFANISFVGAVYGSMAATIIVLLTMEAAALIVLLGAQVIADLQRSIHSGTPWYEDPGQASVA
jgi:membrane protein